MKTRIILTIACFLLAVSFTSYAQDYPKVLDEYIQSRRISEKTTILSAEKTGENTYSGIYCIIKAPSLFSYQFYAYVKGGQVQEFFEKTDDDHVFVITFDDESFIKAKNSNFQNMPEYTIETKAQYDARMKRGKK